MLLVLISATACQQGQPRAEAPGAVDSVAAQPQPTDTLRLPCATGPVSTTPFSAQLGDSVALRPAESVLFPDERLTVRLTSLVNSPCPQGVVCVWEGVGAGIRYEKDGRVEEGMNRVLGLGYKATIVRTDYKTCAVLRVDRSTGQ